jgi:hypothetical protein
VKYVSYTLSSASCRTSVLIARLFVKKQFVEKEKIKPKESGINAGS